MILAEVADKIPPAGYYYTLAIVLGISAATALAFLNGKKRILVFSLITALAVLISMGQVDTDLVDAVRDELGEAYLNLARFWIIGAAGISAALCMAIRLCRLSRKQCQD